MRGQTDGTVERRYRKLAAAVLLSAVADLERPETTVGGIEQRLTDLTVQVEAGQFLVEREDALFWFQGAGLNMRASRHHNPQWRARLAALRARQAELDAAAGPRKRRRRRAA